jgi:group I intron endonuclease
MAYIYALLDPKTNECKYVGVTENPKRRSQGHYSYANKGTDAKSLWVRQLKDISLRPGFIILEETPAEEKFDAEHWWVSYLKTLGAKLLNETLGGLGSIGFKHSAGTIAKLSVIARQRDTNPMLGRKHTEESKKKISATRIRLFQKKEFNS